MTDKAITLLLGNLDKMATTDELKIAILEQSIVNGWQGIFPLKDQSSVNQTRNFGRSQTARPQMSVVKDDGKAEVSQEELERMLERARARKQGRVVENGHREPD